MDSRRALTALIAVSAVVLAGIPAAASAHRPPKPPAAHERPSFAAQGCVSGCGSGSAVGPDKALYVTRRPGRPRPASEPEDGRHHDIRARPAAALPDVGMVAPSTSPSSGTPRTCSSRSSGRAFGPGRRRQRHLPHREERAARPRSPISAPGRSRTRPRPNFFVPSGVQYALQPFRDGLPGHRRSPQPCAARLPATEDSRSWPAFGNVVPTGLAVHGRTIVMGEAGPIPHLPDDGKITRFTPTSSATRIASGASLIVDVEFGRDRAPVRAVTRRLGPAADARERRQARRSRHGTASARQMGRQPRAGRRGPGPADVARVHRRDRLRRSRSLARCSGSTTWGGRTSASPRQNAEGCRGRSAMTGRGWLWSAETRKTSIPWSIVDTTISRRLSRLRSAMDGAAAMPMPLPFSRWLRSRTSNSRLPDAASTISPAGAGGWAVGAEHELGDGVAV